MAGGGKHADRAIGVDTKEKSYNNIEILSLLAYDGANLQPEYVLVNVIEFLSG